VRPESLVYGALIGIGVVLLMSWLTGRPPSLRRPNLLNLVFGGLVLAVPNVTEALGLGFAIGVALVFAAAAIVYAWNRFRAQPN
jgi:uncharacterized membrane protein HdeD (DUF308 family)